MIFPDNVGTDGATLEVWRVRPKTGQRSGRKPLATFVLGPDGAFTFTGPGRNQYEFVVKRPGELPLHNFFERFPRSDRLVRVNVAPALEPFFSRVPTHTGLAVIRYKEYWGDRGAENDVLSIDGVDVINPTTAPSGAVGTASVAFFIQDVDLDFVSNLTTVPFPFSAVAFLTGADLYVPVGSEPLPIVTVPRGDDERHADAERPAHPVGRGPDRGAAPRLRGVGPTACGPCHGAACPFPLLGRAISTRPLPVGLRPPSPA